MSVSIFGGLYLQHDSINAGTLMMKLEEIKSKFTSIYGTGDHDVHLYFGPGRVNLIGEHTDYNNGYVLPCALSFGTYLAIRKTNLPFLEFHSDGFDYSARIALSDIYFKSGNEWVNYPLGIIETFRQAGRITGGLQFYYYGDIPPAAGLSSSASIEMVTAFALNDLYHWNLNILDLIKHSKKSENEFIGVNCGIMDMFSIGQGKKGHAVFLNCETLGFVLVPLHLHAYKLVIVNTNKKRGLGDSKYNERVAECAKAVEFLSKEIDIHSLGAVTSELFSRFGYLISDPVVLKRARHVISENDRVLKVVNALNNNDIDSFGRLMAESHTSLRDDYEVTGFELDSLVDIILEQPGVKGARMTGAGFGGCAIALVKEENLSEFQNRVFDAYKDKTGYQAEFYLPEIGNGVMAL